MINFYNQVPTIYTSASRDFQYLSWLINIVLNSVKHNVDDLYKLPTTKTDPRLAEILAMTLGFKVKRNYNQKQLMALVSIIPSILKYKGTEKAVTMSLAALVNAAGAPGDFSCSVSGTQLTITVPKGLIDITLFIDLLDYILPAGMTCRIVRKNQVNKTLDPIIVGQSDSAHAELCYDLQTNLYDRTSPYAFTGLSTIFDIDSDVKEFSANFTNTGSSYVLNVGQLDNTVIPITNILEDGGSTEPEVSSNLITADGLFLNGADGAIIMAKET
jgi:hypothetical protein